MRRQSVVSHLFMLVGLMLVAMSLPAGAALTDRGLSDWGTWNRSGDPSFTANPSYAQFASTWANEDDRTASEHANTLGHRAGGEWFDLEGLYIRLDLSPTLDEVCGLEFALITSFNGMNPKSPSKPMYVDSDYTNNYRHSPVIALDLDGAEGYDWALVLDTNDAHRNSYGTDYFSATPSFYAVDSAGWMAAADLPDGFGDISDWKKSMDPPDPNPVDFVPSHGTLQTTSQANSWRYRTVYEDGTTYYKETTSQQMPDTEWRQSKNWTWKGSLTFQTPIAISASEETDGVWWDPSAHISMPCGNDWIDTSYRLQVPEDEDQFGVPEPSLGLLLLAGIVPLGLAWKRRRQQS